MNTRRIVFWSGFIVVIGLMVWGLIVASKREVSTGLAKGVPASISAEDHIKGSADAPVTLIEYSDFECSACQTYYFIVDKLLKENHDKVKFVYRHFPLPQHTQAIPASLATEAAGKQGRFWEMYDLIFSNYANWVGKPTANVTFRDYAVRLGLDLAKYDKDIADPAIKARILADKADGERIGVNGTPTFFINGKAITPPGSYAQFKKLIEDTASSSISN